MGALGHENGTSVENNCILFKISRSNLSLNSNKAMASEKGLSSSSPCNKPSKPTLSSLFYLNQSINLEQPPPDIFMATIVGLTTSYPVIYCLQLMSKFLFLFLLYFHLTLAPLREQLDVLTS